MQDNYRIPHIEYNNRTTAIICSTCRCTVRTLMYKIPSGFILCNDCYRSFIYETYCTKHHAKYLLCPWKIVDRHVCPQCFDECSIFSDPTRALHYVYICKICYRPCPWKKYICGICVHTFYCAKIILQGFPRELLILIAKMMRITRVLFWRCRPDWQNL